MQIGVADIRTEVGLHKTVPVQVTVEPVEMSGQRFEFEQPFTGKADIWNSGDELLVRARLSGEVQVECSRCLTRFSLPMEVSFEEFFREGRTEALASEAEEEAEDRSITLYEGDEIDLTDPLRDNVLLELPMKPLCRVDCKGLCPHCGTNLNESTCACTTTDAIDPRLSRLKDLLPEPGSHT